MRLFLWFSNTVLRCDYKNEKGFLIFAEEAGGAWILLKVSRDFSASTGGPKESERVQSATDWTWPQAKKGKKKNDNEANQELSSTWKKVHWCVDVAHWAKNPRNPSKQLNHFLKKLAVDGAFGSYSEASGGRLASLAYTPPPLASLLLSAKKIGGIK